MSKSASYFNKLKKIKKAATWESSKKLEEKETDALTKLQQYEEVVTQLQTKIQTLEKNIENRKITEQKLSTSVTMQKALVIELTKQLEDKAAELRKYSRLQEKYIKKADNLAQGLQALQFYAQGKHVEKSTFGNKVSDTGQTAQKCIDEISPNQNSEN